MDYRFLNSNKEDLGKGSYKINFRETDEYNQVITFLSREQWLDLIKSHFNFKNFSAFDLIFEHIQNSIVTKNAIIVFDFIMLFKLLLLHHEMVISIMIFIVE